MKSYLHLWPNKTIRVYKMTQRKHISTSTSQMQNALPSTQTNSRRSTFNGDARFTLYALLAMTTVFLGLCRSVGAWPSQQTPDPVSNIPLVANNTNYLIETLFGYLVGCITDVLIN